jgi:hypothetical protein
MPPSELRAIWASEQPIESLRKFVGRRCCLLGAQKRKKILLESLASVLELLGESHHRDAKYLTNRY